MTPYENFRLCRSFKSSSIMIFTHRRAEMVRRRDSQLLMKRIPIYICNNHDDSRRWVSTKNQWYVASPNCEVQKSIVSSIMILRRQQLSCFIKSIPSITCTKYAECVILKHILQIVAWMSNNVHTGGKFFQHGRLWQFVRE